MEISLISNTGVQFYSPEEDIVIDLSMPPVRPLRFFEFEMAKKTYVDQAVYFSMRDKFVTRNDLIMGGYLNPVTGELVDEDKINFTLLNTIPSEKIMTVGRLDDMVGVGTVDKKFTGLELIENQWIPLPFFESGIAGQMNTPTNWCRLKLVPNEDQCTPKKRVYRLVLAFDTQENPVETGDEEALRFDGQSVKHFALCGIPRREIDKMSPQKQARMDSSDIPMIVYQYCDMKQRPWLNTYLQTVLRSTDLNALPQGKRLKYLVYYIYFVTAIHKMGILPEVKVFAAEEEPAIKTNLVLDIGNSRTFGLIAEDPLDEAFSRTAILGLRDLATGQLYQEPFDMRLCFVNERFGLETTDNQFRWPSILRLGKEAQRDIYNSQRDLTDGEQYDTSHSSPKRYLWDTDPYQGQWKFITEKEREHGPAHSVFIDGLMQQFRSDGSFTPDPAEMGGQSAFSRSSLMTFCFIEILLQARMQINSYEFRRHAGNENRRRRIARVIITAPTAMTKKEQIILRRAMHDATIAVRRFLTRTYNFPYDPDNDNEKVEIVPSVRDLTFPIPDTDLRKSWNYDEATCCQMVYLYSELRRYLGNAAEFFSLYGKRRNDDRKPSLTIASIDIGAGTSDLMICNYADAGESVTATPLFWESFHTAGDDLVKRIITDVILEGPKTQYPGASGIITAALRQHNCPDPAEKMHHFFGDTASMGVVERRMRKEFNVQILIPVANHLLDLLQRGHQPCTLSFDEIFSTNRPSQQLLDFFNHQFGFRFEELTIGFNPEYLNEIIRRVFEIPLRKWAAIFYTYRCDIVLMGGRPCSLGEIRRLIRRLMPVTPNRLISMNDYRVGAWYPGSTDTGRFSDKKSLVATGALIAYLAEAGKLPMFKLSIETLKRKIQPTSEFVGLMNTRTGIIEEFITPDNNYTRIQISGFPVYFGCRQLNVQGYPTRALYSLDYNRDAILQAAADQLRQQASVNGTDPDAPLPPDVVATTADNIRSRIRAHVPLTFSLQRDYFNDKEEITIDDIADAEGNPINPNFFRLSLCSRTDGEAGWLDSGTFILRLG